MPNTITEKLIGSAEKYRKQLLQLPAIGVTEALVHMTGRPGVIHKETTTEKTTVSGWRGQLDRLWKWVSQKEDDAQ